MIKNLQGAMTANDIEAIGHVVAKVGCSRAVARSVASKAMEYLRKYNSKMGRESGVLGNSHVAKPAVCVDLACTCGEVILDLAVDTKVLQRCSGVTAPQYQRVRSIMMKMLGLKQHVTPRDLCIQFGCLKLEPILRATLEEFKLRMEDRNSNAKSGKDTIDIRSPKIVGAAFTLVAGSYNGRPVKKRLLDYLGIQNREYSNMLEIMSEAMHDVFFDDAVENKTDSN
jgi:origin recognition complex subunit 6